MLEAKLPASLEAKHLRWGGGAVPGPSGAQQQVPGHGAVWRDGAWYWVPPTSSPKPAPPIRSQTCPARSTHDCDGSLLAPKGSEKLHRWTSHPTIKQSARRVEQAATRLGHTPITQHLHEAAPSSTPQTGEGPLEPSSTWSSERLRMRPICTGHSSGTSSS